MDGDGLLDALGISGRGLEFLRGIGNGSFAAPVVTLLPFLEDYDGYCGFLVTGDFNHDGLPDAACEAGPDGTPFLLMMAGLGAGRFGNAVLMVSIYVAGDAVVVSVYASGVPGQAGPGGTLKPR